MANLRKFRYLCNYTKTKPDSLRNQGLPGINVAKVAKKFFNSKIVLGEGYLRLTRVAILRYKIAYIASQHHVIYLTLST